MIGRQLKSHRLFLSLLDGYGNRTIVRTDFVDSGMYRDAPRDIETSYARYRQAKTPHTPVLSDSRLPFKMPKRIDRSPTAVLEALSATVGRDPTAPQYRFMDDPYFIPANPLNKRTYALSKESGRRAARYMVRTFPHLVEKPLPEPVIPAYLSKSLLHEPMPENPTDGDIVSRMKSNVLVAAMDTWRLIKKQGREVDPEVQQELLERLCFSNSAGVEPEDAGFLEEQWYAHFVKREMRPRWKPNSLADELFNSVPDKTPSAFAAMICGKAKYMNVEEAFKLFEEMEQQNMPIPVQVFNCLIANIHFVRDNIEARWELLMSLLSKMDAHGIKPNLRTLNASLEIVSRIGAWRRSREVALSLIAELRQFGIEPSLGSFDYLLLIFCRERGPISYILNDILNYLENNQITIRDASDYKFFPTAMEVAARHLQNVDVAKRVDRLFGQCEHLDLLVDAQKENIYYGNLFRALLNDSVDEFFRYYDDLVPMTFTPDMTLMVDIIKFVEFHDRLDVLPRLWTDIGIFGLATKETVVETVMDIMMNNPNPDLRAAFALVAHDLRERLNKASTGRNIAKLAWTGQLYGNIATLLLRQGDLDGAWLVIQEYLAKRESVFGIPSVAAFKEIIESLVGKGRSELRKLRQMFELAVEFGFTDIIARGEELGLKMNLTGTEMANWREFIRPGTAQMERTEMDVSSIQEHKTKGV